MNDTEIIFEVRLNKEVIDYPYGLKKVYPKGQFVCSLKTYEMPDFLKYADSGIEIETHGFNVHTYAFLKDFEFTQITKETKIEKKVVSIEHLSKFKM